MGGDGMGVPSGVDVRPRHQVHPSSRAQELGGPPKRPSRAGPRHGIEETHLPQHDPERAVP